jgi:hypothetical protein
MVIMIILTWGLTQDKARVMGWKGYPMLTWVNVRIKMIIIIVLKLDSGQGLGHELERSM